MAARPFRVKRGGKYIGNFRQPLGKGVDWNLRTEDADEALRRGECVKAAYARGVRGKLLDRAWGAAAAANATVKGFGMGAAGSPPPTAPAPDTSPAPSAAAGAAGKTPSPPPAADAVTPPAVPAAPAVDPATAANAAAADVGAAAAAAGKVSAADRAKAELESAMAELNAEGDLGDQIFDGIAAGALWLESKAIELGINWRFKRAGDPTRVQCAQPAADGKARKYARIGLKLKMIEAWPWLLDAMTPGWAIVAGMAFGAAEAVQGAKQIAAPGAQAAPGATAADAQPAAA